MLPAPPVAFARPAAAVAPAEPPSPSAPPRLLFTAEVYEWPDVGRPYATRHLRLPFLNSGVYAGRAAAVLRAVDSGGYDLNTDDQRFFTGHYFAQAPVAVRSCARTLRLAQDEGLDRALWREADAQAQCYGGADLAEGIEAVAGKRKPVWTQYEDYRS